MAGAAALILAAGRGERMRPLTDHTPKPLLLVRGQPLLQWHLQALVRDGIASALINTAWLGEQIEDQFGTGFGPPARPGEVARGPGATSLHLHYSAEGRDFGRALETAGGIVRALPVLADVFWVLAGDVFAPDFRFSADRMQRFAESGRLAHLWLVPNPAHNARGDFGLAPDGLVLSRAEVQHTYSTIGLYRKALFAPPYCNLTAGNPTGRALALAPLLRHAMQERRVSGELYAGTWIDIGTPQRLQEVNRHPLA